MNRVVMIIGSILISSTTVGCSTELKSTFSGEHKKVVLTQKEIEYIRDAIKELELSEDEEKAFWECLDCE